MRRREEESFRGRIGLRRFWTFNVMMILNDDDDLCASKLANNNNS